MADKLIIVESPAKANTIKKFLGGSTKVVASMGHIRDLPKSKMGIDIEHDFEPQYINIRGKGDFIKSPFPLIFMYSGSKSFSILTPSLDFGKSLICPIDATTFVFPPKNFFIVLAFAGDSTIINLSAINFFV